MKNLSAHVGRTIKSFRVKRDWRQKDLAERASLPVRTVGRIERGEVDLRVSTLAKIAKAFGKNPRDLLP